MLVREVAVTCSMAKSTVGLSPGRSSSVAVKFITDIVLGSLTVTVGGAMTVGGLSSSFSTWTVTMTVALRAPCSPLLSNTRTLKSYCGVVS